MLCLDVAVVKTNKYASSQSGDSVEVVERAKGGLSMIMADGQGSGKSAKLTSTLVVNKAMNLLAEGTRDGAVARASHDFLYTVKNGRVSATLTIVSVDMETKTVIISRNGHIPVLVLTPDQEKILDTKTHPIGVHRFMKPEIKELELEPYMTIVAFTDGFLEAGEKYGEQLQLADVWKIMKSSGSAKDKAQTMFDLAVNSDKQRPGDDTSVMVISVTPQDSQVAVRTLNVSIPI